MSRRIRKSMILLSATAMLLPFSVNAAVAGHEPTAPAEVVCTGTATVEEVDANGDVTGRGITAPVTEDGGVEDARDFRWSLETTCDVVNADGLSQHNLNAKGTANGWCGHSTAPGPGNVTGYDNIGSLGQVTITNIEWVSAGTVLEVTGDHDAHLPDGSPAVGELTAEVDATGGQDCTTTQGSTSFQVVISGEAV